MKFWFIVKPSSGETMGSLREKNEAEGLPGKA
jgi:hypothetical protein